MEILKYFRKIKAASKHEVRKPIAVILVDMQVNFVKGLRKGEAERIIPNQLAIIKHCNQSNIPIVALELNSRRHGKTIDVLMRELKKNSNFRLIEKDDDSGFCETELDYHLKSLGASKLFIIGINADYCVKSTALDAIDLGYEIITSNEVISGRPDHSKDNSIRWFRSNGHYIDNVDEFIKAV